MFSLLLCLAGLKLFFLSLVCSVAQHSPLLLGRKIFFTQPTAAKKEKSFSLLLLYRAELSFVQCSTAAQHSQCGIILSLKIFSLCSAAASSVAVPIALCCAMGWAATVVVVLCSGPLHKNVKV